MYTLRFPFALDQGQEKGVLEQSTSIGDLNFSLNWENQLYVLTVTGLPSEEEGKKYIKNVWAGLMWSLLHHGTSFNAELETQEVAYAEDPDENARNFSKSFGQIKGPLDGLICGDKPAVFPSDKMVRPIPIFFGRLTITTTLPVSKIFKFLVEGVSFPRSARIIEDPKLRVALELYGAYFTEVSANAKFLTLVMALEVLGSAVERTHLVITLLEKWGEEVKSLMQTIDNHSDDADSLNALSQELIFRKVDSISRQIRNLVLSALADHGDSNAEQTAKRAVKIYKLRSILVHKGKLENQVLVTAISDARTIVERVLRARFIQQAKGSDIYNV